VEKLEEEGKAREAADLSVPDVAAMETPSLKAADA